MRKTAKMHLDRQIPRVFFKSNPCEEEEFLEQMAADGWIFYNLSGHVYSFFESEPRLIKFKVDYSAVAEAGRDEEMIGNEISNTGWIVASRTKKTIFAKEIIKPVTE